MTPFVSITTALIERGLPLAQFQEFLLFDQKFRRVAQQLKELQISPEEYLLFLESQTQDGSLASEPLNPSPFPQIELLGNYLLEKGLISLQKFNHKLQNSCPIQLTPQKLLHHLMRERLLSIEAFVQYNKEIHRFDSKNYRLRSTTKGIEFYPAKELKQSYGKYQVLEELARGGMGIVYKAYHPELNQVFALKVLQAGPQASERALKRFHREIQTSSKLQHPNLVKTQDCGIEGDNQHYFVMEYIEGKTLRQWLQEQPSPSIRERIEVFVQLLDGLGHAHEQGIIHRDLKPGNILLNAKGQPKLTDFGLAKDIQLDSESQKLTRSGALLGTPMYMAPEQVRGEIDQIDSKSDLYSLAVCLYEALTGSLPYMAENEEMTSPLLFKCILNKDPLPLTYWNPKFHPDLNTILMKSLEKSKDNRYSSALDFQEELKRFLLGTPIQSQPSKFRNLLKKFRRNQLSSMLIITLFVFSGFFFLSLWTTARWNKQALLTRFQHFSDQQNFFLGQTFDPQEKSRILLRWFHQTNQLMQQIPFHPDIEKQKWAIGLELISLQKTRSTLSDYLLQQLEELSTIGKIRKKSLEKYLRRIQLREKQHFNNRLEFWKTQLIQQTRTPEELQDFLFEMQRQPVALLTPELTPILQRGGEFFSAPPPLDPMRAQYFYHFLKLAQRVNLPFETLGVLNQSLRKLGEEAPKQKTNSLEKLNYMILLSEILGEALYPDFFQYLYQLRWKMGENQLFWVRTEKLFIQLATIHLPSSSPLKQEETWDFYLKQAFLFRDAQKHEKALELFLKVIQLNPQATSAYINAGKIFQALGKGKEAISVYDLAERLTPGEPILYNNRANAYLSLEQYGKAIQDFERAIQLKPNYFEAYCNRGSTKQKRLDFDGALKDFSKAIEIAPQYETAHFNRGNCYQILKKYELALKDYSEVIRLNPKNSSAYSNRGIVKQLLGDLNGAIQDFDLSIQIDPQAYSSYINRSLSKMSLGDRKGALMDSLKALEIKPDHPKSYSHVANALEKLGDYTQAHHYIQKALVIRPDDILATFVRAQIYFGEQNYSKAMVDLNTVLARDPEHYNAYELRAKIYILAKNSEKALQDLSSALEINPYLPDALVNRGGLYAQKGEVQNAIKDFDTLLQFNPKSGAAYYNRGYVRQQMQQDLAGAIQDYNKAIELEPPGLMALLNRGNIYTTLKKFDLALQDFQTVLKHNPQHHVAYFNIGNIYFQNQDFQKSISYYTECLKYNPTYLSALQNRGSVKQYLQDYRGALADFNQSLQLFPNDPETLYNRGNTQKEQGNYSGAIQDYTQALRLNPKHDRSLLKRGLVYLDLKQLANAEKDFQTLQINFPSNPLIDWGFGNLYLQKNNREKAKIHFALFLKKTQQNQEVSLLKAREYILKQFPEIDEHE